MENRGISRQELEGELEGKSSEITMEMDNLNKKEKKEESEMETIREPGRCAMYSTCGKKGGIFGQEIPCVDNEPARRADSTVISQINSICGPSFLPPNQDDHLVCCTSDQLSTLSQSLSQAEIMIATCPACKNNFRQFYCSFTCSPDQSTFLTVTKTQDLSDGDSNVGPAVKEIEFNVGNKFGEGFYDSCKDVKFGPTNGYAMDFIGGGAKDWLGFLRFMGEEKPGLGSPFQISFPDPVGPEEEEEEGEKEMVSEGTSQSGLTKERSSRWWNWLGGGHDEDKTRIRPLNAPSIQRPYSSNQTSFQDSLLLSPFNSPPLSCSSDSLSSRCGCPDCPSVCTILPPLDPPKVGQSPDSSMDCRIGKMSCFSFGLVLVYVIGLMSFLIGAGIVRWVRGWRNSTVAGGRASKNGRGWGAINISGGERGLGGGEVEEGLIDGDRTEDEDNPAGTQSPGLYDRLPMSGEPVAVDSGKKKKKGVDSSKRGESTSSSGGSLQPPSAGRYGRYDNQPSGESTSTRHRLGTGASLMDVDPTELRDHLHNAQQQSHTNPQHHHQHSSSQSPSTSYYAQPRAYSINTWISTFFYRLGLACARRPYLTIAIGLAICGGLNAGWSQFEVEKDPVRLWVSEDSKSAKAKKAFDEDFGPFYRAEQMFVTVGPWDEGDNKGRREADGNGDEGEVLSKAVLKGGDWKPVDKPILNWERLKWWSEVEHQIRTLKSSPSNLTLKDVCFSPSTNPDSPSTSEPCVVQSVLGYYQDDLTGWDEESWRDRLDFCAANPNDPSACLPGSMQPLIPKLVLGGVPEDGSYSDARALVVTFVVKNSLDPEEISRAEEWEEALKEYLESLAGKDGKAWNEMGLSISFSTGVSLEEELNKSTNTDVPIVVISYLVMFFYVSISLGGTAGSLLGGLGRSIKKLFSSLASRTSRDPIVRDGGRARSGSLAQSLASVVSTRAANFSLRRRLFVESKFVLGLWGIAIVLLSVSTSVGLFSLAGIKVTLIIAEVIPFLVLAIGVDNVFILQHELERRNAKAYASVARHGPSATSGLIDPDLDDLDDDLDSLPSAEERVARALARMGPSILLSSACEAVAFALGALVGMPAVRNFAIYAAGAVAIDALLQITVFVAAMTLDLKRVESNRVDCFPCIKFPALSPADLALTSSGEGFLTRFIRTIYAPNLLRQRVKYFVLALFTGLFFLSWIGARQITLGLDQRLALPSDSYLVDYFNSMDTYFDVGPPVYFVAKELNLTRRLEQQHLCGRFSTCDELSIANTLEAERKRPEVSYLMDPPAVWIDDFFQWLNPILEGCCRVKKRHPEEFCSPRDSDFFCKPCYEDKEPGWNITMEGFPKGQDFIPYLQHWLESPTNEDCPLAGKASYSSALHITEGQNGFGVQASHFRTFHTALKTQEDFINAMTAANRIADDLSQRMGGEVFPYSLFYVFFDQYSHIEATTTEVILFALLAVLVVTGVFLGSWRTSLVVTLTVLMSTVDVMGIMGIWGVSLNAISLVNLVISIGIGVEFCAHIARAFMGALGGGLPYKHPAGKRERDERVWTALVDVGPSVFSGITLTKLIGIAVLAGTHSKLLQTYYVRMWLALIISGALHGLVFLPVALSLYGGQGFSIEREDEDWMATAVAGRYGALEVDDAGGDHDRRPLFGADDEDDAESLDSGERGP